MLPRDYLTGFLNNQPHPQGFSHRNGRESRGDEIAEMFL